MSVGLAKRQINTTKLENISQTNNTLRSIVRKNWNIYCNTTVKKRSSAVMIAKLNELLRRYRHVDKAILFLRLFIGAVIMLHVIGKLQRYNAMVVGFPPLLFNNGEVSFVLLTTLEALFAVMIGCGFWTRFAAFMMSLGMFVDIFVIYPTLGWLGVERQVLYIGIYLFLVISGGGKYAIDAMFSRKSGRGEPV